MRYWGKEAATMDCNKAETLLMRYMDNIITKAEAEELREHTNLCSACRQDFEAYALMVNGFKEMEIIEAPVNFEDCVMEKIRKLPKLSESSFHCLMFKAWGFVLILLAISIVAYNRLDGSVSLDYSFLEQGLIDFSVIVSKSSGWFNQYWESTRHLLENTMSLAQSYLFSLKYVFVGIFAVLMLIHVHVFRKGKVHA